MVLGKIVEKITGMYNDSHLIHLILLVLGHDAKLISAFPCRALLTWNWDKTRIIWKSYSLVKFLTWRWGWVVKLGKAGVEGCETIESRKRECVLSHFYHDSGNFNICWCLRWWFLKFFPFGVCHPFALLCCVVGAAMSSLRLSSCSPRKKTLRPVGGQNLTWKNCITTIFGQRALNLKVPEGCTLLFFLKFAIQTAWTIHQFLMMILYIYIPWNKTSFWIMLVDFPFKSSASIAFCP